MLTLTVASPDAQAALRTLVLNEREKARLVLLQVGIETVAYLRSLTDEMRPPAKRGEGERQAHPGHWADVTSVLEKSYGWAVDPLDDGWRLTLSNTAEYAAALEARDGYFVLTGVLEDGGPVEQALRLAARAISPDWEVRWGALRQT